MKVYAEQRVRDIVYELERVEWYNMYKPFYRLKYHDLVVSGSDYYIIDRTLHDVFYLEVRYTYDKKYKIIPHCREHTYDSYFRDLSLFIEEAKEIL